MLRRVHDELDVIAPATVIRQVDEVGVILTAIDYLDRVGILVTIVVTDRLEQEPKIHLRHISRGIEVRSHTGDGVAVDEAKFERRVAGLGRL